MKSKEGIKQNPFESKGVERKIELLVAECAQIDFRKNPQEFERKIAELRVLSGLPRKEIKDRIDRQRLRQ